jgi:ABC-type multidrug transport system fused ATPase/permease subunit
MSDAAPATPAHPPDLARDPATDRDPGPDAGPGTDPAPDAPDDPGRLARRRRFRLARRRRPRRDDAVDALVGEMDEPPWLAHGDEAAGTGLLRMLRKLPGLVSRAFSLAWEAGPGLVVTVATLQVVSGCLGAFGLLATTSALQPLLTAGPTPQRVREALPALLVVGAAATARVLLDTGVAATSARLSPKVGQVAEARMLRVTVRAELAAFDDPDFYNTLQRARDRGARTAQSLLDELVALVSSTVGLIAVIGVLGVLHPVLLPLLVASVVPPSFAALRSARSRHASWARLIALHRRRWMLSHLLVRREEAPELRALTAQEYLLREHDRVAGVQTAEEVRLGRDQARDSLVGQAAGGVGLGATYAVLGWLLYTGQMPLAVAGTAMLGIRAGRGALTQLIMAVNRLYEEGLYLADYESYMTEASARARRVTGAAAPVGFERIDVRGVTFRYPDKERPALADVDITIRRGEVIALVGENGSGKTTLAKLLAGLYDPQAGTVEWDGVDLATVDADSIAEQVAVVLQEPARWPMTARANIAIGRHDRSDPDGERLALAAREAGADEVVGELAKGYDTLLSRMFKDGAELSGGQWQRLAVARGFYRDAALLICDEPTASLDAKAEHAVYDSIRTLAKGRTIVLITHRLASTREATRIYVLDKGRLVEQGTHAQLMATGGSYAELYRLQAAGYRDDHGDAA